MASESLGDVETPVGTLRCTLSAFENINAKFGSFGEAYRRCLNMDAAAVAVVVAEATDEKIETARVKVWRSGMNVLVADEGDQPGPVLRYLTMLSNGGKMPATAVGDAPKGEA